MLKDNEEKLEDEMDPPRNHLHHPGLHLQCRGVTGPLPKRPFRRKVLTCFPWWAPKILYVPPHHNWRLKPTLAQSCNAGEDRPGWVHICWGLHFALQASILGLKCGKILEFGAQLRLDSGPSHGFYYDTKEKWVNLLQEIINIWK